MQYIYVNEYLFVFSETEHHIKKMLCSNFPFAHTSLNKLLNRKLK